MRPLYYQDEKDFYKLDRGVTVEQVVEIVEDALEEAGGGPQGEAGPQGPQGETGPQGPQGPAGG